MIVPMSVADELARQGKRFQNQQIYDVYYRDRLIGSYVADLVIENQMLLELKAVSVLRGEHEAQVMNYLKASGLSVGLLINFGTPKLQFKRIVWSYDVSLNI